jgi:hypothetical protein
MDTTDGAALITQSSIPILTVLGIAAVTAAASAMNGFIGAIFLTIIWIWLYGGVLPMVPLYLKVPAQNTWAPHLLLPLILFLIVWQLRLRGRIGPSWGLRHLINQSMRRRQRSFA